MRHVAKCFALALALSITGLAMPSPAWARGDAVLVPPNANAYGKSFDEWNVLQTQWVVADDLGGGTDLDNPVGRVRLLPGSFLDPTPVFDITLPPGTPFVASPFFLIGERYDDPGVPDDDPVALAAIIAEIFAATQIRAELDGRVVLEGTAAELVAHQFGPIYYDEPIVYAVPQPRGPGLNALAALWTTGIGAIYHPLPVGQHTLVYTVQSAFLGDLLFTYNITVSPK